MKGNLRNELFSEWNERYGSNRPGLADEVFCLMNVEHTGPNSAEASNIRFHPTEICLVAFKLCRGVIQVFHTFLKPKIPTGFAAVARKHSELRHEIPLQDTMLSEDYKGVAAEIHKLLMLSHSHTNRLYCPKASTEPLQCALDFLRDRTNMALKTEVCCLEYLLAELFLWKEPGDRETLTMEEVQRMLEVKTYNYETGIQCQFHYKKENYYCARATTLRDCYIILDVLGFKQNVEFGRLDRDRSAVAELAMLPVKDEMEAEDEKGSADDSSPFRFIRPKVKNQPRAALIDFDPPSTIPNSPRKQHLGMLKRGILRDLDEALPSVERSEVVAEWIENLDPRPDSASPADSDMRDVVGGMGQQVPAPSVSMGLRSRPVRRLPLVPGGLQLGSGAVKGQAGSSVSETRATFKTPYPGFGRGFRRI